MIVPFLTGLFGAYFGGLPFGPLNLSVLDIRLRHGRKAGAQFAFGASIVEIAEAAVAVVFGSLIYLQINTNAILNVLAILFLVSMGVYFIVKKENPEIDENRKNNRSFLTRGIGLALLNPQAIPFWLILIAFLKPYVSFDFREESLVLFLAGVFLGKYLVLSTYGILSEVLKSRLQIACSIISKAIGLFLIFLGLIQGFLFYLNDFS